jgi:hypothetical protein
MRQGTPGNAARMPIVICEPPQGFAGVKLMKKPDKKQSTKHFVKTIKKRLKND